MTLPGFGMFSVGKRKARTITRRREASSTEVDRPRHSGLLFYNIGDVLSQIEPILF